MGLLDDPIPKTDEGWAAYLERRGRERDARLAELRQRVGWPENPYDPDTWPDFRREGKTFEEVAMEYIEALEGEVMALDGVLRMVRPRAC